MIFSFPKEKTVLILVTASIIRFPASLNFSPLFYPLKAPIYFVFNFIPTNLNGAVVKTIKVNAQLEEKAIDIPQINEDEF